MKVFKFLSGYSEFYGVDNEYIFAPYIPLMFSSAEIVIGSPILPPQGGVFYSRPVNPNFYGIIGITNNFKFLSGYEN